MASSTILGRARDNHLLLIATMASSPNTATTNDVDDVAKRERERERRISAPPITTAGEQLQQRRQEGERGAYMAVASKRCRLHRQERKRENEDKGEKIAAAMNGVVDFVGDDREGRERDSRERKGWRERERRERLRTKRVRW